MLIISAPLGIEGNEQQYVQDKVECNFGQNFIRFFPIFFKQSFKPPDFKYLMLAIYIYKKAIYLVYDANNHTDFPCFVLLY